MDRGFQQTLPRDVKFPFLYRTKKIKSMRTLIQLALVLLVGILVYNYFYGTSEEKAQSREVFKKTGQTVGAAWNLLKSEKAKFDAGKYDNALDKLGGAYRAIRERAQYVDEKVLRRLDELETRKSRIEGELDAIEKIEENLQQTPAPTSKRPTRAERNEAEKTATKVAEQLRRKEALLRSLDSLMRDTDALLKDAQQE
jgi:cytochrome c556